MKVKADNLSMGDMDLYMRLTNERYNDNLKFKTIKWDGRWINFTLTVKDSKDMGGRRAASGRRIAAACWHAHRDFMNYLFNANPEAVLKSAQATYDGLDGFLEVFMSTGRNNIGSQVNPLRYYDACDCQEERRGELFHATMKESA